MVEIDGRLFTIRRMSNDDVFEPWKQYIARLDPELHKYVILTVCPKRGAEVEDVLRELARTYDLFFWVMRHPFSGNRTVATEEEHMLRTFGEVEVCEARESEETRAALYNGP